MFQLIGHFSTRAVRFAAALIFATCFATIAAAAKCNGTSILPNVEKSHPEIYKRTRAAAAKIINTEAIFWRVSKAGLEPSYLFGTMHVSDPRILELTQPAQRALRTAKLVALEIGDMSPDAMMAAAAKVPHLMVYTDGSRLDERLSKEEFLTVSKVVTRSGMPGDVSARLRPWLVNTLLSVPACEQRRTAGGTAVLDDKISRIAKANNIPVVSLETIESQLKTIAGIPDADQVAMLRVSLAFLDKREDLFETLIQAYLNREIGIVIELTKAMAKIAGLKSSRFANFNRDLIKKRNLSMFETSQPLVDGGPAFIAVGAAHLVGETGLVALYRKAGFTVSAIN